MYDFNLNNFLDGFSCEPEDIQFKLKLIFPKRFTRRKRKQLRQRYANVLKIGVVHNEKTDNYSIVMKV